jgi:hypothetical protein
MDQYDFFKQLLYRFFFSKKTPFSSLKSVRMENKAEELGTGSNEQSLRASLIT